MFIFSCPYCDAGFIFYDLANFFFILSSLRIIISHNNNNNNKFNWVEFNM